MLISVGQRQTDRPTHTLTADSTFLCVECSFSASSAGYLKLIQKTCLAKLLNYVLEKLQHFQRCHWRRPCNIHASVSTWQHFDPLKKKGRKKTPSNQRNTFKKAKHRLHFCPEATSENARIAESSRKHCFIRTRTPVLYCTAPLIHGGRESLSGFLPHGPLHLAHSKRISSGSCRPKRHFTEHATGKV